MRAGAKSSTWRKASITILRHVEDFVARNSHFGKALEGVVKILMRRFVTADILGRDDGVEWLAEQQVGAGKGAVIDIGDGNEFEMPAQISHRFNAVGEGRPETDRIAKFAHLILRCGGIKISGQAPEDARHNIAVGQGGVFRLNHRLMTAIGYQQFVFIRRHAGALQPRRQSRQHAALPIDKRSVAIESECGIVTDPHGSPIPRSKHTLVTRIDSGQGRVQ